MNNYVTTPVGLEPLVSKIQDICFNPDAYHRCGAKPTHYLINLDPGNGHSTVAAYVSDAFHRYGIRHFGGLDLFLEYTLDGSMAQLRQVLNDIKACAVYTNEYEGVVAIDISGLASHLNEAQVTTFLKEIPAIAEHATLILFIPSKVSRNIAQLIDKLITVMGDTLEVVNVSAYTEDNLVEIVKVLIDEAGVDLDETDDIDSCILSAIHLTGAVSIKDAKQLVQTMVKNASFEHFVPVLNSKLINAAFSESTAKEVK